MVFANIVFLTINISWFYSSPKKLHWAIPLFPKEGLGEILKFCTHYPATLRFRDSSTDSSNFAMLVFKESH
jgi:hypothetical protein